MIDDFRSELRERRIEGRFRVYKNNIRTRVQETGKQDKCRLKWVEDLILNPVESSGQAEQFTRRLYAISETADALDGILNETSMKLLSENVVRNKSEHQMIDDPFQFLAQQIRLSQEAIGRGFQTLTPAEKKTLEAGLYSQTTLEATEGYRFGGSDRGHQLIALLLRIKQKEILNAGFHLAELSKTAFIEKLRNFYRDPANRSVLREFRTPIGVILVGGDGPNIYNLDRSSAICAVIDFGGDDVYEEGTVGLKRPVLAIIDFGGNDQYRGRSPGIQGGAVMGASLLIDLAGEDSYHSQDVAQGSSLAGVGILIDEKGNDSYVGDRRIQGQSVAGFGILLDRSGKDTYRAALYAQGSGGPLGAGVLIDRTGDDHYFAGGKYPDSYHDSPGFGSWSQGIGTGTRDVANGGIGVLLDGTGNDVYEADYFSHGGGYWFGAGFARDFEGHDRRLGPVRSNFDGSIRSEKSYLRWGTGFGCHFAAGFVFDDEGNDTYYGNWASIAYAWDFAVGVIFDGNGNDRYHSTGSGTAEARDSGFAALIDLRGTDRYTGDGLGRAEQNEGIISFAILQDRDGFDTFSQPVRNHSKASRGWPGGIFLDR
jgi:hypothetical protein